MLLKKRNEIEEWLDSYNIRNYELIKSSKYGYVVNVNGDVKLSRLNLKKIEVKFNYILDGCFTCSNNQLESLEGCPNTIEGDFFCYSNELTIESLKYLPKKINTNYLEIQKNEKLGSLQYIRNFKELKIKIKEFIKIQKEKENLLNIINKDLNNYKINKI